MLEMPNIFTILDRYINDPFAPEDEVLTAALQEAHKAGLPEIQVSAGQGKLLQLF
jgi:predicted O-methyltransferase YrrM